jgi:hypothetical protein
MAKRIYYSITLLLVPLFFYSCGTVNKNELTEVPTIALIDKSVPAVEKRKTNDKVALIVKSAEEKVLTYESELTEKEAVESVVTEVAEVEMDDLPAVSETREREVMKEVDPYGPRRIYSIQTRSLQEIANAQRYFQSLMKEIDGSPIEYTRIEKIGIYYAVRIGKFNGYTSAKKYLADYQPLLSSAIIVDNYPHKLIEAKKGLDRDGPEKIYAVQTASFVSIAKARSHFKSMIREFNGKGVDYVRIVKIGTYYAVRLGKFDGYTAAKKFLNANPSQLPSAIIVDNYPLRKTISSWR